MATSPKSKEDGTPCPEETDFITECQDGNLTEVKRFVLNGLVDINCQDTFGQTCVMSAAWKNRIDMFDFLEKQNCDMSLVDVDNSTALHFATVGDSIYIVKKLVDDHGCDIHWRDKTGKSPLLYATYIQIIQFLIDKGADVRAIDKKNNTILHIVCEGGFDDAMKYIIALNIIDVETKGENGSTPLMMAVLSGHTLLVDILYTQHNASLTLSNDFGLNVFHMACIAGDLDMIKYLVSLTELREYQRTKDKDGNSPIQLARNEGHDYIVTYLQTL